MSPFLAFFRLNVPFSGPPFPASQQSDFFNPGRGKGGWGKGRGAGAGSCPGAPALSRPSRPLRRGHPPGVGARTGPLRPLKVGGLQLVQPAELAELCFKERLAVLFRLDPGEVLAAVKVLVVAEGEFQG